VIDQWLEAWARSLPPVGSAKWYLFVTAFILVGVCNGWYIVLGLLLAMGWL
jgi:hypothetical protein